MTILRDWPATLRRASFRGVSFHVERDTIEGDGRRLVVHEFPLGEQAYIEDNGRDTTKVKVTAYLVSDNADSHEKSLRAACATRGPGSLVLPLERMLAHCDECKRDASKDKLGYIAFDLSFVREGAGTVPFSVSALGAFASGAASSLFGPLAAAFAALFRGLGVASFVQESAQETVRDIAATIDAVRAQTPVAAGTGAQMARLTQILYDDAASLTAAGARADVWTRTAYRSTATDVSTEPLVRAVWDAVESLREGAEPERGREAMAALASFGDDLEEIPPATASRRTEAQNRDALATVLRVAAMAQMIEAIVLTVFADRRAAIQARADVSELIGAELDRLSSMGDATQPLWDGLADLRGRAVEMLSRSVADLAPVLTLESSVEMPALWWANRLYGDAARADEIADRNRAIHPLFMAPRIEALAR